MKISNYSFGRITIDGHEYTSDVLIFPDGRIDDSWWRDKGHILKMEDITDLVEAGPELIVAGAGASGRMQPAPDLADRLKEKGIQLKTLPTVVKNEKRLVVIAPSDSRS